MYGVKKIEKPDYSKSIDSAVVVFECMCVAVSFVTAHGHTTNFPLLKLKLVLKSILIKNETFYVFSF